MKKVIVLIFLLVSLCIVLTGCSQKNTETNDVTNTSNTDLISLFYDFSFTLDGAYAQQYAYNLYKEYKDSDSKDFINLLSNYDIPTIKSIIELLVGETVNNDREYAIKEFSSVYKELHDDKNLSEKENYIVYALYTWLLYFQISI